MNPLRALGAAVLAVAAGAAQAELVVVDQNVPPHEFAYPHPFLRFLVFTNPVSRGQAILPPAPVFVTPPPLIWRAPGAIFPYPPATPPGFNRPGAPSPRDQASYLLARAHAMSQGVYRSDSSWSLYLAPPSPTWTLPYGYGWGVSPYPPVAPAASHPSNRDNAAYLIERAHRFSQDAYRKP